MFVFFSVKKMPPLRKPGATKKTYRKQQRQVEMLTFFIENRVMWNRIGTINWLVKSVLHDTFSSNHKNVGKNYQTFSCLSKAFQVLRIISTYKHQNASTESEAVGYLSRLSLNHIFLLSQKKHPPCFGAQILLTTSDFQSSITQFFMVLELLTTRATFPPSSPSAK